MSSSAPPSERSTPLTREEIAAFPSPAGPRAARLALADVIVDLRGLPVALADAMVARYGAWMTPVASGGSSLKLEVAKASVDYFLPPAFATRWEVYRVLTDYDGRFFRATSYRLAWCFDLERLEGRAVLAQGELDPAPRAMENLLRSAVAWLAIGRRGLFVHGASIVTDGACRLFYGPSGAGKSTLSALSGRGQVLSDDLTLLMRRPEGLTAVGGPFRGTYDKGGPVHGVFPVAGFYRLRKDVVTTVRRGDGACFADLVGNLPWIVDQMARHPGFFDRARDVVGDTPFHYLHFRKDEDFWPAIDAGPARD
jgi:hypothetical protein